MAGCTWAEPLLANDVTPTCPPPPPQSHKSRKRVVGWYHRGAMVTTRRSAPSETLEVLTQRLSALPQEPVAPVRGTASSSTSRVVQRSGVPLSLAHCGRSLGVMRRCLSPFLRCVFSLWCCITSPDCTAMRPGHMVQDAEGTVRVILTKRAAHLSSHKGAPSSRR